MRELDFSHRHKPPTPLSESLLHLPRRLTGGLLLFSVTRPRLVLAAFVLLTVAACLFVPRIRLQLDARSLVPVGESELRASDEAAAVFGLRDVVLVGVVNEAEGIYNPETLTRISSIGEALAKMDGIVPHSVTSLANVPRLSISEDRMDARPLLPVGGERQAGWWGSVAGEVAASGLDDGVLVARDGRAAMVYAEVRPEADRYDILAQVKRLKDREAGGRDAVYLSGTSLAQAELGQASAGDLFRLVPLVLVVLGAALMLSLRHPAAALISLLEIGVSLCLTLGLMGLTGQAVFVTTLVLPVVLISVGVSDDVFALTRYFDERRRAPDATAKEAAVAVFLSLRRPIAVTTITTSVGLLSMALTSLEPLRVFGIFSTAAILCSTLCTFTLVPALLVLLDPAHTARQREKAGRDERRARALFDLLVSVGPRRVLLSALVLACVAAWAATRVRVEDSWINNLPAASEVARDDAVLNEALAGTTTLELLVDSGQPGGFLQPRNLSALRALAKTLGELPQVGAVRSVGDDIVRLDASLRAVPRADYLERLDRGEIQLSGEEIERDLMLLEISRRASMSSWIDREYRRARLTVFVRSADYNRIKGVIEAAGAAARETLKGQVVVTPFGDGWISYVTVRLLVEGQLAAIVFALLVNLLVLSVLLKSVKTGLVALLPVGFSVLFVFALLGLSGLELGIANSMFVGIALGCGCDFAAHLAVTYRQGLRRGAGSLDSIRHAFTHTAPAIITSATAIASGFSILLFSNIRPNAQLGLMVCLCLAVCAAATLVIVPSLVLAGRTGRRLRVEP